MKIGDRIYVRGYVDEIRKDTVIVRNDGGYFGTILSEVTGELPSAQPETHEERTETHACDLISRQAAIDALTTYIYNVYKAMVGKRMPTDKCRQAAESVIGELPPVQPKNGTLIIPLNESDFKSLKRIMLDNKPWCRTFYEDVPGEAHWIKSYTPDDGEIYECDNCGVTWQFNDGGPEENEAFFCPKCGFKMERGEADDEVGS